MLLRTRVTLIVSITYSLLVAGLTFAGLKNEELADERYAQATLNGQDIFWRKLVENTVQRLETHARTVADNGAALKALDRRDPSAVLAAVGPMADELRAHATINRLDVLDRDGELMYSSAGSLLEPPILDAGTVRAIIDSRQPVRGVLQDASRTFTATLAYPLQQGDEVVGIAVMATDLRPPLAEFKASTGADIFLVDRNGQLAQGTDEALWHIFADKISVRKSRLLTWPEHDRYYSVVVLPVQDGFSRVIGALVTARDVTATQTRQRLIRQVALAGVGGFLVLVLGIFYVYLRRSFHPLDEAIAVLNALSRGDTSVTLEVRNARDEIGRIAGTVGVFRDNAVMLGLMQQRRERQRRRQELFIRLQMLKLSEMLEEEARAAILADMKQIEAMAARGLALNEQSDSGKGELEVLGVAFQTMSDRIREQHLSLEQLIAERTREADILREALRTRDQLNALRQELDFARELQLSSLPQVFPPFPERDDFLIHASMVPAKEVGGDFYDFFLIDRDHLGFVIGDASGKGVPAAMFIAITRSLVKAVAPLSRSPGECLAFVNTMLSADNPQTLFATCFYGVLDTTSGQVSFCNAGHPPPLILRAGKRVEAIRVVSGVALGVMEGLEYDTGSFTLADGEALLLYTDGVTEAQDSVEALYDEHRLIALLEADGADNPDHIIGRVQRAVEEFVGDAPQFDDITMLALRLNRAGAAGAGDADEVAPRLSLSGFQGHGGPDVAALPAPPEPSTPPPAPARAGARRATPQIKVTTKFEPRPAAAPEPPAPARPKRKMMVANQRPRVVVTPQAQPDRRDLRVNISSDLEELARLAQLVDDFAAKLGLPEKIAFNLNLCLDELITNTVSYGYDDAHKHDIALKFTYEQGRLVTEITDDGKPYDPFAEAPEPNLDLDVADRPIGGLGVFLVKEFMDSVAYRRDGGHNIVRLEKQIPTQES